MLLRSCLIGVDDLRQVPFFAELNDQQLQWVVNHSRQWQTPRGAVLESRVTGVPVSSDVWVLLNGGWQVDTQADSHPSGNESPGKWYSSAQTHGDNRLVTSRQSNVMRIRATDMEKMLAQNFPFSKHFIAGRTWYLHIAGLAS